MCWISSRLAVARPMDVLTRQELACSGRLRRFVPISGTARLDEQYQGICSAAAAADATQAGTGQSGTLGAAVHSRRTRHPRQPALHVTDTMVLSP